MNEAKDSPASTPIARRDWLKATSLGAAAALFTTGRTRADDIPPAEPAPAPAGKPVRGIVFLVSDGMSPGVFTMAEAFSNNIRGTGTAWWKLWGDPTAARGLMDTASANSLVTDSAAAATAWGGGIRVNNGAINVDPAGKTIEPISKALRKAGARLGLVTTTRLTHATPAGFAASVKSRGEENEIAQQYVGEADVLLGGGTIYFDKAKRGDNTDVFAEFQKAGHTVVRNRDELLACRDAKIMGTFDDDHLPYTLDHIHDESLVASVPTLTEMTVAALDRFLADDRPFLLMVEGGRVDHAAHLNCIAGVLHDQLAFDDAVAATLAKTAGRGDILVVVTSDHGNANPGLNGIGGSYQRSTQAFATISSVRMTFERFFQTWSGTTGGDPDKLVALVREELGFAVAKDERDALFEALRSGRVDDWNHQHRNSGGLLGKLQGNHTGIGWTGTSHTYDPTIVSAVGPQAERFGGLVLNSDVHRHLCELLL